MEEVFEIIYMGCAAIMFAIAVFFLILMSKEYEKGLNTMYHNYQIEHIAVNGKDLR